MLRRFFFTFVALLVAGTFAVSAVAVEVTHEGVLVCAKCALNRADAHECQDVLIVTDAKGAKTEFYVTKNAVWEEAGEACTLEVKARVTGEVSEKDGRKWITASKIQKL